MLRAKELEVQYYLARANREKSRAAVESNRASILNEKLQTCSRFDRDLREQLNQYIDKFKQVSTGPGAVAQTG